MWPIAYAIVSTVSPNASDTPNRPIPTFGNPAESTALPQPPKTNQKVPNSSASIRRFSDMVIPPASATSQPTLELRLS